MCSIGTYRDFHEIAHLTRRILPVFPDLEEDIWSLMGDYSIEGLFLLGADEDNEDGREVSGIQGQLILTLRL